ncbi:response regulator transcription factor [Oscillospiraceae bacterium OttesenSCG-928-G22]|nr:response regulator transcription factor [Oscillospiraceae bacterium OttesenSCG-928-G22]
MSFPILAVDRDAELFRRENAGWKQRGIEGVRVDSMSEALEELGKGAFLFVAINADNIGYLPMLPVMRELTTTPIFIITANFTINEQVRALHSGADVYAPFQGSVEDNIMSALALLHRYGEQGKRPRRQSKAIPYRKLLVLPGLAQVFCGDVEVPFTPKEYNIFLYLLANCGIRVSFRQVYRRVWGIEHEDKDHRLLWNHIIRMRKKISDVTGEGGYIENKRGIGFLLPADTGR